ncbi:MAG: ABC transporter permease [Pirellulales bacterium]
MLTVLGIFIGVASVIWLLAIGEGISRKAQEQIAGLGAENIIVRSLKPPAEATAGQQGVIPYGLTRRDFELLSSIPGVSDTLRIREVRSQFHVGDKLMDGRLVGCTPGYANMTHLDVKEGRFLEPADLLQGKNVCVLAAGVARKLFPLEDPLGQQIFVDSDVYQVVGVLEPRGATSGVGGSFAGQDFARDVYIPIETFWKRIGDLIWVRSSTSREGEYLELSQITLKIRSTEEVPDAAKAVERLLRRSHDGVEDYALTVPLELLKQAETTRLMFIVLLGFIAAISLVVGGIGIMNIMLATVTERTREIGIRRALGAKQRDITRQFLVETTLLSAIGGVTGILGGLSCLFIIPAMQWLMNEFFPEQMANLPDLVKSIQAIVVPWSIPLSFGISVFVGVVFGLYPASRAAKMDPIEALRHQ